MKICLNMDEHPRQWPPIKRAARACLTCRARKLRCNVEDQDQGQPCSNCLLDKTDCQVGKSKRGRKPLTEEQRLGNAAKQLRRTQTLRDSATSAVDVCASQLRPRYTDGWLCNSPVRTKVVDLPSANDASMHRTFETHVTCGLIIRQ